MLSFFVFISDMVIMQLHFDSFDYETQILYQDDFFFFLCKFFMVSIIAEVDTLSFKHIPWNIL